MVYVLEPAIWRALMKGVELEIKPEHLQKVSGGYGQQNPEIFARCSACGYHTNEDFKYCLKCGKSLE